MKRRVRPLGSKTPRDQPVTLPFVGDDQSLLVRTWYADEAKWKNTKDTLAGALAEHLDHSMLEDTLTIADDPTFAGWAPQRFVELHQAGDIQADYMFIADEPSQVSGDAPLLVLNLELLDPVLFDPEYDEPPSTGRTFRVPSRLLFSVHANLSLATMPFGELADFTEAGGPK